ncbi:MAG: hypothetical protein U0Q12_01835 [Vicinamibacterales bacterium]
MLVAPVTSAGPETTTLRPPTVERAGHNVPHDPRTCPICSLGGPARGAATTSSASGGESPGAGEPGQRHGPQLSADGVLWLPTLPPGMVIDVTTRAPDPSTPRRIRRSSDVRRLVAQAYGDGSTTPTRLPGTPRQTEEGRGSSRGGSLILFRRPPGADTESRADEIGGPNAERSDGDRVDSRVVAYTDPGPPSANGTIYSKRA